MNENLRIVSIREIMAERLSIPNYQRPYRWGTQSALRLITDTYEAFMNGISEYRMGSVVLHRENRLDSDSKLNIVDGQQCLTTLSILLFVVHEMLQDISYANLSSLLNEEYNELSREAIVNNLQIIKRKLREFDTQEVKKYADYLLDNCSLLKIITNNEQEAFQFFDSQNSRGKALSPHDLLKSYHLREMNAESESDKIEIIQAWENKNQNELEDLFADHLFPLVRWFKNKNGLHYSTKDIQTFKGIKPSNPHHFATYAKASHLYVERFNADKVYELTTGTPLNQFQLTQPLIAGKRFFSYTLHYANLYREIVHLINTSFNNEEIIKNGTGDFYVYNLFINILIFFVDKFSMKELTPARLSFLHRWAYTLRLTMKNVYRESVNKYAQGQSDRVNKGLNLFTLISEMQDPIELDTIVLDVISKETFQKSNLNIKRYQKLYNKVFGEED
jgi:hypothetical protein